MHIKRLQSYLTFWKVVFAAIVLVGSYALFQRLFLGLGASTHLSDQFPWGMWIGFDVLVGVALAGGGFTIAATVHLFHLEKYEPVGRPAVLTAFLGYSLVGVAIMLDIGLPWRIWHPLVMWNPHSVMFEVAWCVMLYTSVLALEFSPVVFERFGLKLPLGIVRAIYMPLVIMGVLLSMMHQSSLGSVYLIVPDKLYGLWYTPWLPVFFFITAVAGGLAMTIVESYLSHRAFGKKLEDELLEGLARVMVVIIAVYSLWRFEDLTMRGNLALAFELTPEAVMFWGEIGLCMLVPSVMLLFARVRRDQHLRFLAALLVVLGLIIGRMNVAVTGMLRSSGASYFPAWQEFAVTLLLVAIGFAAFAFAVRYLDLFPKHEMVGARPPAKVAAYGVRGMPTASTLVVGTLWVLFIVGSFVFVFARSRDAQSHVVAPTQEAALGAPAVVEMKLPGDFVFPVGEESPGEVTFSHASHQDYASDGCKTCHREDFSLRRSGAALAGAVTMQRMEKGELCGRCHNGEMAFDVKEACDSCHK